ncbi:hypothetical protein Tco_1481642, partial [Tanacetum coccineum]
SKDLSRVGSNIKLESLGNKSLRLNNQRIVGDVWTDFRQKRMSEKDMNHDVLQEGSKEWDDQREARELEVVEVLLEEETLMSSSSHGLMVMWRMLVIWVCDQWRVKKWLWWMEFLRVHLRHLVIKLGNLEKESWCH